MELEFWRNGEGFAIENRKFMFIGNEVFKQSQVPDVVNDLLTRVKDVELD